MTKKQVLRMVAFGLVVCFFLCILCDLFELKNSSNLDKRFNTYRNLNEETVDAVVIGTSGIDRYWIAAKAYEEYGMTTYALASDAMPSWLFTNVIDEIYTYQNPELIIVDMRAFGQTNDKEGTMDVRARRVLDSMDFYSLNRIKTAFATMRVMHENFDDKDKFDVSYLLPYVKYHTMWAEDDYTVENNWGNKEHEYLGFFMSKSLSLKAKKQSKVVYNHDIYEALDPLAEKSFYDLVEYAEEKGIELLFLETPQFKSEVEIGRCNTLIKMLEEKGLNYVNYCETDEEGNFLYDLNLDRKKDFYNAGHTNYYGAEKFTTVFAKYLDENYAFEDHRDDATVQEEWDGINAKIKDQIKKWEDEK